MEFSFHSRLKHAWNAFFNKDPTGFYSQAALIPSLLPESLSQSQTGHSQLPILLQILSHCMDHIQKRQSQKQRLFLFILYKEVKIQNGVFFSFYAILL